MPGPDSTDFSINRVTVGIEVEHHQTATSIGTVLALRSITLRNELAGTVSQVKFVPGQTVEAGAVLVALDVSVEEADLRAQQAQAVLAQAEADPYQAQALNQVVRMENVPAEMGMDITIEQVPDVANMLDEQFQALTKLAPSVVFPPEVYIKASNLRNKRELLEELKKAQGGNPEVAALQAQRAQLEIEEFKAKIEKLRAETIATLAKADQTDAQTGSIVKPQIVEPGQAVPQQAPTPPQQTSFQ